MRMRGRRLLPIVLSLLLLVLLCSIYFSGHQREAPADEFLVHLPAEAEDEADGEASTVPGRRPSPAGPLLNLTDFQYLLPSNVCRKAERELLGKWSPESSIVQILIYVRL